MRSSCIHTQNILSLYNMNFPNDQNVVLHRSGRMYTTHLDNSELTNHLFPYLYLQQNITHTVTITLSKAVQPLSKNYPQNYQYANPNHNFQLITIILVSFITHQIYTLPVCFSTTHFSRMVHIDTSDPTRWP